MAQNGIPTTTNIGTGTSALPWTEDQQAGEYKLVIIRAFT